MLIRFVSFIFQDVYCDDKLVAIKVLHQHNYTLGFQESDCIRRLNTADPFCLSPTFRMHVSRTKLSSLIGSLYLRANFPVTVPVMFISCTHIPYIINVEKSTFFQNTFCFDGHYCMVFELLRPEPLHSYFKNIEDPEVNVKILRKAWRIKTYVLASC